jgi:carbon storage regulator CsrA
MLVITRKAMQRLYIGDEICVTVVRLEGGQVRLGIEAPREVTILRGELTRRGVPMGGDEPQIAAEPRRECSGEAARAPLQRGSRKR